MKNQILDSPPKTFYSPDIFETVHWWEQKRSIYNLILVLVQILMLYVFSERTYNMGFFDSFILISFFTISANACYCAGWGVDVLSSYYKIGFKIERTGRIILWLVGVVFSIWITVVVYLDLFFWMPWFSK